MTPEQLSEWCARTGITPEQRALGSQRPTDAARAADNSTGAVLRRMSDAGIDDKLKMSPKEAAAKMQKGLSDFAERERRRMAVANYGLKQSTDPDKLPRVELPDRVGLDNVGPRIVLK